MIEHAHASHAARARPRPRLRALRHQTFLASAADRGRRVPLTIAFIIIVIALLGRNHAAVVQILGSPLVAIIMLLFIVTTTYHMWLGMQVIIEDYVHDELKLAALIGQHVLLRSRSRLPCVYAILKLSFGV